MALRVLVLSTILLPACWLAWHSASGGEAVSTAFFAFGIGSLSLLGWLIYEIATYHTKARNRTAMRAGFGLSILLAATIGQTHWPLRLSFLVWREQIESTRVAIQSGRITAEASRIGPFAIARTEMMHETFPALVLHDDEMGPTRLIYTTDHEVGNTWSEIRLDENWVLNAED